MCLAFICTSTDQRRSQTGLRYSRKLVEIAEAGEAELAGSQLDSKPGMAILPQPHGFPLQVQVVSPFATKWIESIIPSKVFPSALRVPVKMKQGVGGGGQRCYVG